MLFDHTHLYFELIHCATGIRIAIFSTGKRASTSLMSIAMGFLLKIPGAGRRVCKLTSDECYITQHPLPPGCGLSSQEAKNMQKHEQTSRLQSLPSSKRGQM
jgi:hypothetical protein